MNMKPTWMQRRYIRLAVAAMGRGITLPWVGQKQKKRDAVTSARYVDEVPHNWRIFQRAKRLAKLNNRDLRRLGEL